MLPFVALAVALTWYVQDNGFFWDSILLASRYGQWYYQTRFSTLFVPEEIAGYPPLFGMYVAAGWHLFGKSVPVSHFLMLPFLVGIVWQLYLLVRRFLPPSWLFLSLLLIFLDPTLLAQSAQVAPDVVLLFLYLVCLNALLQRRHGLLGLALVFMALLSPRSQILLVAVFLTQLLLHWHENRNLRLSEVLRLMRPYVPAGLLLITWLGLHYRHFGWIGYAPSSAWSSYSALVSLKGFGLNLVFLAWRLLDFGRIALWVTAGILLWRFKARFPKEAPKLLILLLVPLVTLSGVLVWFTNPIGHRYWLVVYVLLGLLTAHLLAQTPNLKLRRTLYVVLAVSLVSGHFWVYPERIAKGWDATLAHLPYFTLRQEMMTYLDQHQIDWQQVGSDFPNLAPPAATDLTHDQRHFPAKDLRRHTYILYSNVFNGFTDQELAELQRHWITVHEVRKGQVYLRLYRKPTAVTTLSQ